jgi:uncharacterized membrane protein YfhO
VAIAPDEAAAIATMQASGFDLHTTAVVEASDASAPTPLDQSTGSSQVQVVQDTPQRIELSVQTDQPGLLVLTDAYYPGWSVRVDGEERPIYPTNVAFRGVLVPAGTHNVVFCYFPISFAIGAWLAVAAFVLLAAAAIVFRWRPRLFRIPV